MKPPICFSTAPRITWNYPDKLRTILLTPRRVVRVEIITESDEGELLHHMGYRVQHNTIRGPMKGGLRFHPSMDEDHAAESGQPDDLEDRGGGHTLWRCQRRHQL